MVKEKVKLILRARGIGSIISEHQLAGLCKCSRPTVHAVLMDLSKMGWVKGPFERKGWQIRHDNDVPIIADYFACREILELAMVRRLFAQTPRPSTYLIERRHDELREQAAALFSALVSKGPVQAASVAFMHADFAHHAALFEVCQLPTASEVLFYIRDSLANLHLRDHLNPQHARDSLAEHEAWTRPIIATRGSRKAREKEAIDALRRHLHNARARLLGEDY
jgi:DNA-binding GntR family transcriptional regulator